MIFFFCITHIVPNNTSGFGISLQQHPKIARTLAIGMWMIPIYNAIDGIVNMATGKFSNIPRGIFLQGTSEDIILQYVLSVASLGVFLNPTLTLSGKFLIVAINILNQVSLYLLLKDLTKNEQFFWVGLFKVLSSALVLIPLVSSTNKMFKSAVVPSPNLPSSSSVDLNEIVLSPIPQRTNTASYFSSLPTHILEFIASFMDNSALSSFQRTSKKWEMIPFSKLKLDNVKLDNVLFTDNTWFCCKDISNTIIQNMLISLNCRMNIKTRSFRDSYFIKHPFPEQRASLISIKIYDFINTDSDRHSSLSYIYGFFGWLQQAEHLNYTLYLLPFHAGLCIDKTAYHQIGYKDFEFEYFKKTKELDTNIAKHSYILSKLDYFSPWRPFLFIKDGIETTQEFQKIIQDNSFSKYYPCFQSYSLEALFAVWGSFVINSYFIQPLRSERRGKISYRDCTPSDYLSEGVEFVPIEGGN